MAGLTLKCPLCLSRAAIRTSERPTPTTVTAELYCPNCGDFKGKFIGEITNIKKANWEQCEDAKKLTFEANKVQPRE